MEIEERVKGIEYDIKRLSLRNIQFQESLDFDSNKTEKKIEELEEKVKDLELEVNDLDNRLTQIET